MLRISFRLLKLFMLAMLLGYGAIVATMYVKQRDMLFNFQHRALALDSAGIGDTTVQSLKTPDGETLEAIYRPPRKGRPLVLYFHGKGTSLANEMPNLKRLADRDFGFLGVAYRGSGNSTGVSTETGLVTDAVTAYDWARAQGYAENEVMVLGQSLGTGVAVQLAGQRPVAAVALGAPYSSVVDVAAERYWYLPVRLLMMDTFKSERFIGGVNAPLLVLHGVEDRTIPLRFGERLFAAAKEPKTLKRIEGQGHPLINTDEAFRHYAEFFNGVWSKTLAAQ